MRHPLARRTKTKQDGRVSDLLQRAESEIQNHRLLLRGQKILIAVSGGVDSMILLRILHALAGKHRWRIHVAHFNHRLRGRASDADEQLVRKTAAALKLPVVVEQADVKAFARKSKLSVEMAARKLRHEFLARAARRRKIQTIALAHHADDQVELFFLRLLRGAGGEGLAGMKWRAPSPADKRISLVRPLLDFSKSELLEFARENKIQFREDATNSTTNFLRNRVRNELLPLLRRKYQPALDKTVLRLMEIVGAESEFVGEAVRNAVSSLRLDSVRPQAERYTNLPVAIQRRDLQSQLAELGVAVDFELVESLRHLPNQFISVGPNISAARDESGAIQLRTEAEPEFNTDELTADLSGNSGEMDFAELKFTWRIRPRRQPAPSKSKRAGGPPALREFFDADKIGGKIILRHWRPGDRFQPIGMKSAVKLQDLLTNAKIPRERRRNLVVAEASDGEIFWVEGLRIGERFKLTPQTSRTLVWRWSKLAA